MPLVKHKGYFHEKSFIRSIIFAIDNFSSSSMANNVIPRIFAEDTGDGDN